VTGQRLTIEECVRRKLPTVFGLSGEGRIHASAVADWIDSGVQPVFRVRTQSGREVEGTGHHPFLTTRGWVPLCDLAVGATIAVPVVVPAFGTDETWPSGLVRLLAYFIAAGDLTTDSPAFTSIDPVIIQDFQQLIASHFPTCIIRNEHRIAIVARPRTAPDRFAEATLPAHPVTQWLEGVAHWGTSAQERCFPDLVWTWSRRYLAAFMRALVSCAGSICAQGGSSDPRIEFSVVSRQLAADMQHALTRFGILSRFSQTVQGAWRVQITSPEAVRCFQEQIGWIGAEAARVAGLVRSTSQHASGGWPSPRALGQSTHAPWTVACAARYGHAPAMVKLARQPGRAVRTGAYPGRGAHIGRSQQGTRLAPYAPLLEARGAQWTASSQIHWDPIVAIEAIGEQQVYDLTVPAGENFVAQDVFVHNSALAMSLAHNAALRHGQSVGIFSLEMSKEQLVSRLLSMDAGVDQQRLRTGWIDDDEWGRISESVGRLSQANIYIDDTASIPLVELRSKARRLKLERGFDLLIIDYLQLAQGSGGSKGHENRVQEISEISRGLKGLARELDVPVLALSQLSRAVESRAEKKPQLSDLRESGCLTGDTPVYLPDMGAYAPIASLLGRTDVRVLALNTQTWRLEPAVVSRAFGTGRKRVYKLALRQGSAIRATGNHKFLTYLGWKRLDTLARGERLALPRVLLGRRVKAGGRLATKVATSEVYWDEIVAIEPDGEEEVYDLTVADLHNFVAGDIVVHNSLEQDSDVVMFIYRDEVYNPDTDRKNIADIIVAKHRNGPVGQVSLFFQAAQTRFRDLDLRTPDDY
jgi:replicative DNA helicase